MAIAPELASLNSSQSMCASIPQWYLLYPVYEPLPEFPFHSALFSIVIYVL